MVGAFPGVIPGNISDEMPVGVPDGSSVEIPLVVFGGNTGRNIPGQMVC